MPKFLKEALKNDKKGTKSKPLDLLGFKVYPQPNNWSCGPMSLRYCFLKWDVDVDPYKLIKLGNVKRSGTSEKQLELMMYHFKSDYQHHQVHSSKKAKLKIDSSLKLGKALILCTEKWQHWVACLAKTSKGYLIFDSSRPGPVIRYRSWKWLKNQLKYSSKQNNVTSYMIISVGKPLHVTKK